MVYSTVANSGKLTTGVDKYVDASSGIATAIQTTAFNMVKARIKAAGLTPPSSDDILAVAEDFYATALKYQRERMTGSLPTGSGAGIASNDNVNNSFKINTALGDKYVEEYIKYASTDTQPSDVNGQIRSDAVFKNLKLNQNDIAEPVNIDGDSLTDDQRS